MTTVEAPAQPVVQPVTRADVLHRAADLLEEFGWCQGQYAKNGYGYVVSDIRSSEAVSFCAAGALGRALFDLGQLHGAESEDPRPAGMDLLWSLPGFDPGFDRAGDWNDTPGRTKAEVVARLRAAANTSPQ